MKETQVFNESFINHPVISRSRFDILMSYYDKWDEVHLHLDLKTPITRDMLQELSKDVDTICKEMKDNHGYPRVYTCFDEGNPSYKIVKHVGGLIDTVGEPLEVDGVKYIKYYKEIK